MASRRVATFFSPNSRPADRTEHAQRRRQYAISLVRRRRISQTFAMARPAPHWTFLYCRPDRVGRAGGPNTTRARLVSQLHLVSRRIGARLFAGTAFGGPTGVVGAQRDDVGDVRAPSVESSDNGARRSIGECVWSRETVESGALTTAKPSTTACDRDAEPRA